MWGATQLHRLRGWQAGISIHAPRVGSDSGALCEPVGERFSIHAPRVGSDAKARPQAKKSCYFNPRSPCGERLGMEQPDSPLFGFQSTLPVWGATDTWIWPYGAPDISIHAPRVGSDPRPTMRSRSTWNFNPRSPCGERPCLVSVILYCCIFQSTLPVWGATIGGQEAVHLALISIHAPRVGSDGRVFRFMPSVTVFQSTLPVWGATPQRTAPRPRRKNFNPRSPCGERPANAVQAVLAGQFQSTLPVWGATDIVAHDHVGADISIHAPRVGSDGTRGGYLNAQLYFNPRSPCGERPYS